MALPAARQQPARRAEECLELALPFPLPRRRAYDAWTTARAGPLKPSKSWQAILEGKRNLRFSDLLRLARAFGFELERQRGSHHILLHPTLQEGLNLQPDKNGQAKPYQVRQLVDLVETYGLQLED